MRDSRAGYTSFAFGLLDIKCLDIVTGKLTRPVRIDIEGLVKIGNMVGFDRF